MRFLIDECTGTAVAQWLRSLHYDVFSVYDEARGLDDEIIIKKANLVNNLTIVTEETVRIVEESRDSISS